MQLSFVHLSVSEQVGLKQSIISEELSVCEVYIFTPETRTLVIRGEQTATSPFIL